MNLKLRIIYMMLGMMTLMPGICFAYTPADSTLLHRIWSYRRNYSFPVDGTEQNVYLRYNFNMDRRNVLLFLVPTMYIIAEGDRNFVSESYGKLKFRDVDDYDLQRQVVCGTIPRQRMAMPPVLEYSTPDFYDVTLYPDHLLSPFHKSNRHLYKYSIGGDVGGIALVHFRPKTPNTQLISGNAVVNTLTGRLQYVEFKGEFDMINFKVSVVMNANDIHSSLPERCHTEASFKFLGNRVRASLSTVYNCPVTLPDSLDEVENRHLMAKLRPLPLNADEKKIYAQYDQERQAQQAADTVKTDTVEHRSWLKRLDLGYQLIKTHRTEIGGMSMRISPILNPQYVSYSPSRGFSYKMKFGLQYKWNEHRYLTLKPELGYNFKLNQIFYTAPLRMNYNPKRNGYAEIKIGNGNRITNNILEADFHKIMGDSIGMPPYKDRYLEVVNNVVAYDWLEIMTGLIYHNRNSLDPEVMKEAGMKDAYRSFAPMLTLRLTPWRVGPVLTVNYERGIDDVLDANLDYERWELDASFLHKMKCMRIINCRFGTGFYTQRNTNYFVDYTNFRDNNLPTGWEDDWSGQFQLLDSRWYNESDYYVRGHVSYDSPMLALSHVPLIGRYFETERIYLSALSIQHTRPYVEVGYGFTNRYFSTGLFTSFLGGKFHKFGCKFTIELFRRW